MLYKRGKVWWFKFRFQAQTIRESANTGSKTVAREAERARRRELELAVNRIPKRERMPLFSIGAREWLATKATLAPKSVAAYAQYVKSLNKEFGQRLVCDIGFEDIVALQRKRNSEGLSARTVNYEIHALRGILKHFNLWWSLADKVKMLRERHDVGRAVSQEDEAKLLKAIAKTGSPALLPLFVLSIDTGLRASEIRSLRRRDLSLLWSNGVVEKGEIIVPTSKTEAGTGRMVPLTRRACAVLTMWFARFPEAGQDAYVFPRHRIGFVRDGRGLDIYEVDTTRPIGEWKTAWRRACRAAGVSCRWHDLRHTMVSRLAENPNVSEETIRALAGHVSRQMLQRYSHIRAQAKEAAIATFDRANKELDFAKDGAQNWAQSPQRALLN